MTDSDAELTPTARDLAAAVAIAVQHMQKALRTLATDTPATNHARSIVASMAGQLLHPEGRVQQPPPEAPKGWTAAGRRRLQQQHFERVFANVLVTLEEAARALLADQPEPPAERDLANVLLTIQQVDRLVAVVQPESPSAGRWLDDA